MIVSATPVMLLTLGLITLASNSGATSVGSSRSTEPPNTLALSFNVTSKSAAVVSVSSSILPPASVKSESVPFKRISKSRSEESESVPSKSKPKILVVLSYVSNAPASVEEPSVPFNNILSIVVFIIYPYVTPGPNCAIPLLRTDEPLIAAIPLATILIVPSEETLTEPEPESERVPSTVVVCPALKVSDTLPVHDVVKVPPTVVDWVLLNVSVTAPTDIKFSPSASVLIVIAFAARISSLSPALNETTPEAALI